MAGTFTIQSNPAFLTARTLIYTAWQLRNFTDADPPGAGVFGYEDFRVKQRGAGANLSADVGNTAINQAWIRGTTRDGMGLYRADNIDYTAPTANTFLAQINTGTIFTTGDATNPRIDQVFLRILDQQHDGGGSNLLQVQVVDGTATGGATLDNRTGVGATPANSILLADVLMPALATTVATANIRDRRQFPLSGTVPPAPGVTATEEVTFIPHSAMSAVQNNTICLQASLDACQSAALMYLPKRIAGVTKIKWRTKQGPTANANNYALAIFDASGRVYASTASTAYVGTAAQSSAEQSISLLATTTFEPGAYFVWIGNAAATAGSSVLSLAVGGDSQQTQVKGCYFVANVGGVTIPTTLLSTMSDIGSGVTGAVTARLAVPILTLSVA